MGVAGGAKLSKPSNLIFCYDAANPKSYVGSGTTVYDVIQQVSATITNGASFSTNNAGYLNFDGSNDYLAVGDTPLVDNLTGDATWEVLFKSDVHNVRCNVYNKSYHSTGTISNETSGSMTLYYGNGADASTNYYLGTGAGTGHFSDDNTWHHYTVVRDFTNTQNRHYKNGVLKTTTTSFTDTNSQTITAAEAATHNITIGKGYAGHFNGQIAFVKIYDTALTNAEVAQSFNNIRGRVDL